MEMCVRFCFYVFLSLVVELASAELDTCRRYPEVDPCMPGGVWDPVLNSCTGYGGRKCYQCYSGQWCSDQAPTVECPLSFTTGNPVFLAEFWLETKIDPCVSEKAHYRPAYQDSVSDDTNIIFPSLLSTIKDLHNVTRNAQTAGYSVVTGVGATMVIYTAVVAMAEKLLENCSRQDCPDHIDVFTQPPYYFGYSALLRHAQGARWNPDADPNSPWTVEIVTHPNNPDGRKRPPLVSDPERVIMDLVYYWPMYTDIDQTLDKPLMIFSSSKHDGLAGTRFGWALVKDKDMAQRMLSLVDEISLSTSLDIELRILNSMQSILSMEESPDGLLPFHEHGHKTMSDRFHQLQLTIDAIPGMKLLNFFNSTGGYAWIHCGPLTCQEEFDSVNLTGIKGSSFGGTDQEIRFTMMMPSVEFDQMISKLKALLYWKTFKRSRSTST